MYKLGPKASVLFRLGMRCKERRLQGKAATENGWKMVGGGLWDIFQYIFLIYAREAAPGLPDPSLTCLMACWPLFRLRPTQPARLFRWQPPEVFLLFSPFYFFSKKHPPPSRHLTFLSPAVSNWTVRLKFGVHTSPQGEPERIRASGRRLQRFVPMRPTPCLMHPRF